MSEKDTKLKRNFSTKFLILAVVFALAAGLLAGTSGSNLIVEAASRVGLKIPVMASDSPDFSDARSIYYMLKSKYNGDVSNEKLRAYLNKGVAAAAEDPYTEYYTEQEARELEKDLDGTIGGGIGAELGMRNNKPTVVRPLKDSPAEKAGLKAGDIILAVNNKATANMSIEDIVRMVRGEVGTTAKITIRRGSERMDISVKREEITSPDIETQIKNEIGIIKLSRFGTDSAAKVRAAAEDMKHQNVKGVILDLRGNGGGYLQTGIDVAGVWLNDKDVVSEKGKSNNPKTLKSGKQAILNGMPTVVLIDSSSASASEIVAGALKDHQAATLIGEKSFGKGSVQEMIDLPKGDMLKVTVANWYTPKGKNISKEGIEPDKKVELSSDDINNNRDPQMDAAIGHLKR
ncbi:MAG: S41 family peptidase [Candidatus Saccharibacteria bacterium]|nr:S41 family peptidase [Candidatus Saccharibacteria bacterium]